MALRWISPLTVSSSETTGMSWLGLEHTLPDQ
jgi:hypothetical protein